MPTRRRLLLPLTLAAILLPLCAMSTARAAPLAQMPLACAALRWQSYTYDGGDIKYVHGYWDNETLPDVCEPGEVALHPVRLFEHAEQFLDNSDFLDFGIIRGYDAGSGIERTWIYSYCSYCTRQWGSHGAFTGDAEFWLAYDPTVGQWLWWLRNGDSPWQIVRSAPNSATGAMGLASVMWVGGLVSSTNSELGVLFHNNLYLLRNSQAHYISFVPTDTAAFREGTCGPRYYTTYNGSSSTSCGTFGSVVGVMTNGSATCP